MASNEQAGQWQLSYIVDRYLDGECAAFAQALEDVTGLAIILLRLERDHGFCPKGFPRHAAVKIGDDLYLDASGTFTLKQARGRFEAPLVVDECPDLAQSPFEPRWPLEEEHQDTLAHARQMLALRKLEGFALKEKSPPERQTKSIQPDTQPGP